MAESDIFVFVRYDCAKSLDCLRVLRPVKVHTHRAGQFRGMNNQLACVLMTDDQYPLHNSIDDLLALSKFQELTGSAPTRTRVACFNGLCIG